MRMREESVARGKRIGRRPPYRRGMSESDAKLQPNWGVGVAIGIGVGMAMGSALGNISLGLALGVALGVAFAMAFGTREGGSDTETRPEPPQASPGDDPEPGERQS